MEKKMFKALLKKQLLEINSNFFRNNKTGTRRSKKSSIMLICFFAFVCFYLGFIFFQVANGLCSSLFEANLGWFYFAMMFTLAIMMGVVGSVFNTYNSIYQAKDNDLLFSMPIPSKFILLARIVGVYIMGLFYCSLITIPTIIAYCMYSKATFLGVVFSIITAIIISFIVLILSLTLGYLVAKITSKMKNKTLFVVVLSVVFMVLYIYFVSVSNNFISSIITNGGEVANKVKIFAFPLYAIGQSCIGNILCLLGVLFATILIMLLVYYLLWKSFFNLSVNHSNQTAISRKTTLVQQNISLSLIKKEAKRLFSSSTYLLNSAIGTLMSVIAVIFLFIQQQTISSLSSMLYEGLSSLLVLAVMLIFGSMNTISASSISIEGKSFWILKSLPIKPIKILHSKTNLHILITLPFTLLVGICSSIALKLSVINAIIVCIVGAVAVVGFALLGVLSNLRHPNLNWVNEIAVVKQGIPVFVCMFGSWLFIGILAGLYFACASIMTATTYLYIVSALIISITALEYYLLRTIGVKQFEKLC